MSDTTRCHPNLLLLSLLLDYLRQVSIWIDGLVIRVVLLDPFHKRSSVLRSHILRSNPSLELCGGELVWVKAREIWISLCQAILRAGTLFGWGLTLLGSSDVILLDFHELDYVLMRHRLLLLTTIGRIYTHLAHLTELLAGSLRWDRILGRIYRIVLGLLDGNHLDVWGDSLTKVIVRTFGVDSAHLGGLLRALACHYNLLLLILIGSAILVNYLRSIVPHDQSLVHILLTGDAIVHRVCMLFSQSLPSWLLHVLVHELLLVKFLLASALTCPTRLVYRLATETAHILYRLVTGLLIGVGLLRLLLEELHLLLLIVRKHGIILHMRSGHCAALLLANEHLWSLIGVLGVTQSAMLLFLIRELAWMTRC